MTKEENKYIGPLCPNCGSKNNYFRIKAKAYICRRCGQEFKKEEKEGNLK